MEIAKRNKMIHSNSVLGMVVFGTRDELKNLIGYPHVKASSFGVITSRSKYWADKLQKYRGEDELLRGLQIQPIKYKGIICFTYLAFFAYQLSIFEKEFDIYVNKCK